MDQRKEKVAKILVESRGKKSVSAAMKEAGYSNAYATNPQQLTATKTWEELMEIHFPDSKLAARHEKLIDSENELVAKQAIELAYKLKNKITERKDLTSGGRPLPQPIISLDVSRDDGITEDQETQEED